MIAVRTLRKRADFLYLKQHGSRVHAQGFVLQWAAYPSEPGVAVGYTASSRGVGNAVKRNRARRRLRAVFDKHVRLNPRARVEEGRWLNIVAKDVALEMEFAYLEKDMLKAVKAAGITP